VRKKIKLKNKFNKNNGNSYKKRMNNHKITQLKYYPKKLDKVKQKYNQNK
jgi:hypothetical protein